MCGVRFYVCEHCGNIIGMIHSSGVPVVCCGEPMRPLEPNTREASEEKHLPVVEAAEGAVRVKVGSAPHPMQEEHHIQWVYLETEKGGQRKCLDAAGAPEVVFALKDDRAVAAYAYCNLHGLWKTQI